MRLVDADALKKAIKEDLAEGDNSVNLEYCNAMETALDIINNAPTISEGLYEAYCRMNDAELEHTERLSFFNSKGEIVGFVKERPQGEWIKVKEERMSVDMSGEIVTRYKCSKCGKVIATLPSKLAEYYPYCHCGADMRKGGAV